MALKWERINSARPDRGNTSFMLAYLIYIAYIGISWLLVIYAANFYYLLYRASRGVRRPDRRELVEFPHVTVQLPLYNEKYVAERLIAAACSLDYPKDRLQIQVLDDSTDDTRRICRLAVEYYRRKGIDIEYLARGTRRGYKAGALQYGLKRAKGEFIAIFDADFVPPRDFLLKIMPYFSRPDLGLVQARWTHLNEEYSTMTSAQALSLDLHFLVEQKARGYSELFMNFNGTAGVWRKTCIIDAGGWRNRLAEDLDLSLRAQLKGWRLAFLPEVTAPAEIPVQMNASKRQQFRWAKGAIQCAVEFTSSILRSNVPLKTKVQSLLQLTRHIVHPLVMIQFLLTPLLIHLGFDLLFIMAIVSHLIFGPLIYVYVIRKMWRDGWIRKLGHYLMMVFFFSGMSLNNTKAVISGLSGVKSEFARTPKFGVVRKTDSWKEKEYVLPFSLDTVVEVFLGLYGVFTIFTALLTRNYSLIPYLVLMTAGFLYIAILGILHSRRVR